MNRPLCYLMSTLKYSSSTTENVLKVGDILKQSRIFTSSDIADYSKLTHDANPIHFVRQCALLAGFKDVPVPGILVSSLFPRIIASYFPGAVYVKQTLEFRLPVLVGDEIVAQVQASNIRQMKDKYMVKFMTTCFKDGENIVIGGEAMAVLPTLAIKRH